MSKINKVTAGIILAAAVGGGAIGAAALPAMADSGTSSSASSAMQGSGAAGPDGGARGPHQANGKTEEVLTGDSAAKVEAAVKAAQPGATIERMETDADGATYEAHITRADGTRATVLLDASFKVTGTEEGMGGPAGGGGRGMGTQQGYDDAAADS